MLVRLRPVFFSLSSHGVPSVKLRILENFTLYLRNRLSLNLRAIENSICGLRSIGRKMRSILRTVYSPVHIVWMHAYPFLGEIGGGWALEFSSFLGPKWHSPIGSMPFHRSQKTRQFQGPTPSHFPSQCICTHRKHYAQGCINQRCKNS
jgi:hypothetical protein